VPNVSTLHAALGLTPEDTTPESAPIETRSPLVGTILFVDEGTMPDAIIYERLFASIPEQMTVVLVGDVNQLSPVGPGTVYETLITLAPTVCTVRLTDVRRTTGLLTENAHAIARGRMPTFTDPYARTPDYTSAWYDATAIPRVYHELAAKAAKRHTSVDDILMDAAARWIVTTACATLMPAYGLAPHEFVQIITPQTPGPLGTARLAGMMREQLNPQKSGEQDTRWLYADGSNYLRKRDPVLVIGSIKANNGTILRNGTAAQVVAVDRAHRMFTLARDSGDEYVLPSTAARECILRYAMTVDRTQGSEYGVVLQITHDVTARSLGTRRRYYTGYTRARRASLTWGTDERIRYCIADLNNDHRYTTLAARIRQELQGRR
jgi:exodeoxyribonuclease V alpha subunit